MDRIISNMIILVLLVANTNCAGLKFRSIINKSTSDIIFSIKPLKESEESQQFTVSKGGSTDISKYAFMTKEGPKRGYLFTLVDKNGKTSKELCFEYLGLRLNQELELNPSCSPDYTLMVYIDGKPYKKVIATMKQKGFLDIVFLANGQINLVGDVKTQNLESLKFARLLHDEICC